jgi:hypothetical protein
MLGQGPRDRDLQALLRQQLAVGINGLVGHFDRFIEGITRREATRQIGNRDSVLDAVVRVER